MAEARRDPAAFACQRELRYGGGAGPSTVAPFFEAHGPKHRLLRKEGTMLFQP
jgi:hypothetical protein